MIPANRTFISHSGYAMLKAQVIQATPAASNIASAVYLGIQNKSTKTQRYMWKVTLSTYTANMYAVGMKAKIANAPGLNGQWEIDAFDETAKTLDILTTIPQGPALGAVGTCTPSGLAPFATYVDPTEVMNNNNEIIGYQYSGAQSFITQWCSADGGGNIDPFVQVVNTDATNGNTVTIRWSLDGMHWSAFPTAISSVAVAQGAVGGWILNQGQYNQIWFRIDVAGTGTYYVNMR